MEPTTTAALAGAGVAALGAIGGAAVSGRSAKHIARMQIREQRRFAEHGIRLRVADAQAAGVHPLYALGAQLPSFNPISVDTGAVGEGIARAAEHVGSGVEKAISLRHMAAEAKSNKTYNDAMREAALWDADARAALAGAQYDEFVATKELRYANDAALASYHSALAAKINQELGANKEMAAVQLVPDQVVRSKGKRAWESAGTHPGWKIWQIGDGLFFDTPWTNEGLAEGMEGLGVSGRAAVLAYNVAKYGPEYAAKLRKLFPWWF